MNESNNLTDYDKFLKDLKNFLKGLYWFWLIINLLLLFEGHMWFDEYATRHWYPFYDGIEFYNVKSDYDLSEFLVYALTPILLFNFHKLPFPE